MLAKINRDCTASSHNGRITLKENEVLNIVRVNRVCSVLEKAGNQVFIATRKIEIISYL